LREVIYPVLELREEKRTFVKVGGGKVDFFLDILPRDNMRFTVQMGGLLLLHGEKRGRRCVL
jgi:hypothetical protein